jgi:hypothetical protein
MKKIFRIYHEESIQSLSESNDYYSGRSFYTETQTMLLPYSFENFSTMEEAENWVLDNINTSREEQFITILPFYIIPKYK